MKAENRMREIWYTAMLSSLKKPPTLEEFVSPSIRARNTLAECLSQWDKIDAALAANTNKAA